MALAKLISEDKKYDLVYIDAGHRTLDVITDACMSWYLIPSGGIIIFDDYLYRFKEDNLDQSVKLAVDAFCNLFNGYFVYLYVGNQVIIQKK
jgi:predicted O-methyltransferase YrrM